MHTEKTWVRFDNVLLPLSGLRCAKDVQTCALKLLGAFGCLMDRSILKYYEKLAILTWECTLA